ncbi:MAG: hypothetical protein FRX48_06000 [Lasallia pustulata]|uniref:F-box domain-containing protein n=1 Tax=Lasallia pustulata TaxID=136370 RepID=A0A5M8PNJ9_9LECA|nr:MAG: hypothetical protein FRX48_06000 [Lasallia pustulata]
MAALNNICFPFLSLPAELPNLVYRHLLLGDEDFKVSRYAQILRTCKQINREATGILYTENVVRIFVSSVDICAYKLPLFSTNIPLQRIETLEVHIRARFPLREPRELKANVLALCRHWPKHHALKKLTIAVTWEEPTNHSGYYPLSNPRYETEILSPFSLLRNIKSITIRYSNPTDVYRKLMDSMHSENEWEETV